MTIPTRSARECIEAVLANLEQEAIFLEANDRKWRHLGPTQSKDQAAIVRDHIDLISVECQSLLEGNT